MVKQRWLAQLSSRYGRGSLANRQRAINRVLLALLVGWPVLWYVNYNFQTADANGHYWRYVRLHEGEVKPPKQIRRPENVTAIRDAELRKYVQASERAQLSISVGIGIPFAALLGALGLWLFRRFGSMPRKSDGTD